MNLKKILPAVALSVFTMAVSGWAVTISGKIRTPVETPVKNARVFLQQAEVETFSNSKGEFSLELPVTGIHTPQINVNPSAAVGTRSIVELYSVDGAFIHRFTTPEPGIDIASLYKEFITSSSLYIVRVSNGETDNWSVFYPALQRWMPFTVPAVADDGPLAKLEAGQEIMDTLVIEKDGYLAFSEPVTVETDRNLDLILHPYVVWPLSKSPELNADAGNILFPYGPRYIGRYDFHAGVDFYGKPRGAPIYTVMDGIVLKVATASSVIVRHADSIFTAYLHLEETKVAVGDKLSAGDLIGTMGNTNAKDIHLHLTLMTKLRTSSDERKSRNPLEILPYLAPEPSASFTADTAVIRLSNELMTVRWVTLMSGEVSRTLDYYEIVSQGSTTRDNQVQNDLYIRCGRPSNDRFNLYLSFANEKLTPDRVIIEDFNNIVTLDKKRNNLGTIKSSQDCC